MSINARQAVVVGLVLGIAAQEPASAGPPYVTDDPKTPPRHAWEINLPYVLLQGTDPRTALVPLFDFGYGLTDAVQLNLQVPILDVGAHDGPDAVGIGDTQLGVKWRFPGETGQRPQVAVNPQMGVPTGSERRGLGAGSPYYIFPLMAEKSWGPWTAFTNVAWVVQSASATRDFAYYGAALTRAAGETLRLGAELHGNGATARPTSSCARRWVLSVSPSIPFRFRSSYPERRPPRWSNPRPSPRKFSVFWRKTRDLKKGDTSPSQGQNSDLLYLH